MTALHMFKLSVGGALVFALAFPSLCAAEQNTWHDPAMIADFQVGIFCKPKASGSSQADDTIKGTVERLSESPVLGRESVIVPAIDQINFGVKAREKYFSAEEVTITVTHPPLGKNRVRKESWKTRMEVHKVTYHGYYLGLSDGDPTGNWTIVGTRGGVRLFEAHFKVVRPSQKVSDPCLVAQIS